MQERDMPFLDPGRPTAFDVDDFGVVKHIRSLRRLTCLEGSVIADIGCGAGAYAHAFTEEKIKAVIGIDINATFLNVAHSKRRDEAEDFIQSSTENIPLGSETVDLVVLIEVLEHVNDQELALREINRILKKGGLLYISVPNKFYPLESHGIRVGRNLNINPLGIGVPFVSLAPEILRKRIARARVYKQNHLVRILKQSGFIVHSIDYMMPPLDRRNIPRELLVNLRRILLSLEATPFLRCSSPSIVVLASRD